jgi:hypothetical protein
MPDKQAWIKEGLKRSDTHILVVCDTFDGDYYPVYCVDLADRNKKFNDYNGNGMQRIMEVIDLSKERKRRKL